MSWTKPKVFVSHIHEHTALAIALENEIEKLYLGAIEVFVASHDISGGVDWLREINAALKDARLVLLLSNERSVTRPWVNFEAGAAWIRGDVPIVPLCFGNMDRGRLPEPLASLNAMSLCDPTDFVNLLQMIASLSGLQVPTIDVDEAIARLCAIVDEIYEAAPSQTELAEQFAEVSEYFHSSTKPGDVERLIRLSTNLIRPLIGFRNRLGAWGGEAKQWTDDFHDNIWRYSQILATDVVTRSSVGSPPFHWYLRKQYQSRLERSAYEGGARVLRLSKPVFDAVRRTNWRPSEDAWSMPVVRKGDTCEDLEIVRILIRNREAIDANERDTLRVLDFDHRAYGIPLFVIDESHVDPTDVSDFAIGISRCDHDGLQNVISVYEFLPEKGRVEGRPLGRGYALRATFQKLLAHERLTTVSEYLGEVMIYDPIENDAFVRNYDHFRRASAQVIDIIATHGRFGNDKVGLDIGCGTGNYTFPFVGKLARVHGLDLDESMIDAASKRAQTSGAEVSFSVANMLHMPFEDASFDVAWSVSSLHYVGIYRLGAAYAEIARVVKKGGTVVLDVGEFLEQHPSLWVAEYFPSLKQRYAHALLPSTEHAALLDEAGFTDIEFVTAEYGAAEEDFCLRAGQVVPERLFDASFMNAVPAFRDMSKRERIEGCERLRRDMDEGLLAQKIAAARARATLPGDLGFIVARRA